MSQPPQEKTHQACGFGHFPPSLALFFFSFPSQLESRVPPPRATSFFFPGPCPKDASVCFKTSLNPPNTFVSHTCSTRDDHWRGPSSLSCFAVPSNSPYFLPGQIGAPRHGHFFFQGRELIKSAGIASRHTSFPIFSYHSSRSAISCLDGIPTPSHPPPV